MIYLLTSSFKALPALNAGALEAGIFISSLVWGFLPFLALLFLTSKVPKPTNWTLSFAFSASETTEMKAFKDSAVAFFEWPVLNEIYIRIYLY